MWEYACTHVRALTRTYACTNPNTQMHTHIHALHAYNGDTHIHARTTHMHTQVVGLGVEKGSRACRIFEKLNENVCLNGFWALQAISDTKHCGDQWGTRSELFNSCKMNSLKIIRIACGINIYMHRLFQRVATDPPKGGVFQISQRCNPWKASKTKYAVQQEGSRKCLLRTAFSTLLNVSLFDLSLLLYNLTTDYNQ